LGFLIAHDLQHDSRALIYSNNSLSPLRLQVSGQYLWYSDGNSYTLSVARPLLTRTDRWGFSFYASDAKLSEYLYLSGNDLDRLAAENRLDSAGRARFGRTNLLGAWSRVDSNYLSLGVTRTFGYSLKAAVSPFYIHKERR